MIVCGDGGKFRTTTSPLPYLSFSPLFFSPRIPLSDVLRGFEIGGERVPEEVRRAGWVPLLSIAPPLLPPRSLACESGALMISSVLFSLSPFFFFPSPPSIFSNSSVLQHCQKREDVEDVEVVDGFFFSPFSSFPPDPSPFLPPPCLVSFSGTSDAAP